MMTYLRYKVATGYDTLELESEVNELCGSGWKPQGGVTMIRCTYENARKGYEESVWVWAQAMVRTEER